MPRASCCCWPPERLAAGSSWRVSSTGNSPSTRSMAARAGLGVTAVRARWPPRGSRRTVSDGNVPTPPGTWSTPRPAISAGGVAVMSTPSKMMAPRSASTIPEIVLQQGGLAGAVGAEQGDDLALVDLEAHVEEHLHAAVADVEVADEEQLRPALAALVGHLGPSRRRRPHLGDVAGDHAAGGGDDEPADDEHRQHQAASRCGSAPAVPEPADDREDEQAGQDPQRRDAEAHRPGPRRDRHGEGGEDARARWRRTPR